VGARRLLVAAIAAACVGVLAAGASGRGAAISFQQIASGFAAPTYVTTAPGDPTTLYVVEQPGTIKVVKNGRVVRTFLDIRSRVKSGGEQGLLSMAFHPNYVKNHLFYVDYTDTNGDTRLVQFRSAGGRALAASARQLLFIEDPYENHNGGQLEFDKQGFLYAGYGDGGSGGDPENRAQNLGSRWGKLLRRNPTRAKSAWQIVGFGLRNPWRFSFDRQTGDLWIGDVGQGNWEEIDFRAKAAIGRLANYGWARFEGNATYDPNKPYTDKGDKVSPVAVYSHSDGCSVTGGYVYRGSAVPEAQGLYFYGDYCSGNLWTLKRGSQPTLLPDKIPNLSSFGQDGNGELYAVSLSGQLYKLRG
jgi:glucose/arabinose dehydrogenase